MLNFTAIDFETANSYRGSPCSVGLVKVRDGNVVNSRHLLIRPPEQVSHFDRMNISIHGITPDMVTDAPTWSEALAEIVSFIDGDVVVAHNAGFDIGVIRYACAVDGIPWPDVDFLCSLVLSRKALALPSYRLPFVAEACGATLDNHHDAASDALVVVDIMRHLGAQAGTTTLTELAKAHGIAPGRMTNGSYSGSVSTTTGNGGLVAASANPDADPAGYLYDRVIVFTGALMSMTRQLAWDAVSHAGGIPESNTTKRTNVLVVGDFNPASLRPGAELSAKAQKAFKLQDKGQPIEVMTEYDFLQVLDRPSPVPA